MSDSPSPIHDTRGVNTTEFWVTAFISMATAFVNSGWMPNTAWQVKVATIVVAGYSAAKYIQGRSDLKSSIAGSQTPAQPAVQVNTADNQSVNPGQSTAPDPFEDIYKKLAELQATDRASFNGPPSGNVEAGLQANRASSGIFRDYSQVPMTSPTGNAPAWQKFKVAPKGNK